MTEKVIQDIPQPMLNGWEARGKLLGYPQCCIDDFLIAVLPRRESVFSGTGFIPCEACKNRDQADVWRDINKNRHKDLPEFPCDDVYDRLNQLLRTP